MDGYSVISRADGCVLQTWQDRLVVVWKITENNNLAFKATLSEGSTTFDFVDCLWWWWQCGLDVDDDDDDDEDVGETIGCVTEFTDCKTGWTDLDRHTCSWRWWLWWRWWWQWWWWQLWCGVSLFIQKYGCRKLIGFSGCKYSNLSQSWKPAFSGASTIFILLVKTQTVGPSLMKS